MVSVKAVMLLKRLLTYNQKLSTLIKNPIATLPFSFSGKIFHVFGDILHDIGLWDKFIPVDATSRTCVQCEVAELAKKLAEKNPVPVVPSVFKFEMPAFALGQTGGIKTWLGQ